MHTFCRLTVKLAAKDAYSYYLYKTPGFIEDGLLDDLPKEILYKLLQQSFYREIQHITLFRSSDIAFVAELLVHGRALQITTGELVYDCGDIAEDMAFISRGNVRVLVDEGSRDTLVGYASQGGYFGDFEYYQRSTTRIARYQAVQNTTLMSIDYRWIAQAIGNNPEAGNKFQQELKNRYNLFQIVIKAPVLVLNSAHVAAAGLANLVDAKNSPPRSPPNGLAASMPSLTDTVVWFKASLPFNREGSKLFSSSDGMQHNNSSGNDGGGTADGKSGHGKTGSHLRQSGRSGRRKSSLFGPLSQQLEAADLARALKENFQKYFNGRVVQRRDRIWSDGMVKLESAGDEEEERIHGHDIRYPVLLRDEKTKGVLGYMTVEMTSREIRAGWLIHPDDRIKQVWDGFMGVLIIYSVLILPMEMAFQMQDNVNDDGSKALQHLWGLSIFDFAVDGLFFLDICLSFQTAYFSDKYDAYIGTTLLITLHSCSYATNVTFFTIGPNVTPLT